MQDEGKENPCSINTLLEAIDPSACPCQVYRKEAVVIPKEQSGVWRKMIKDTQEADMKPD